MPKTDLKAPLGFCLSAIIYVLGQRVISHYQAIFAATEKISLPITSAALTDRSAMQRQANVNDEPIGS
jgi:hypothetical protein